MTDTHEHSDITDEIGEQLPYLRRYARALTGSQKSGDTYAVATLEAILESPESVAGDLTVKQALFRTFNSIWTSSGARISDQSDISSPEARAQRLMAGLTENTREALLLHSIERFPVNEVAAIMEVSESEAAELLDTARREMSRSIQGRIMVIEDEAIIAMDISAIVNNMGHEVTGIARTRDAAVDLARKQPPDMILADIQLADKSSGIDAVNHIFSEMGEIPVVFITAFPERLLTGERPEPAFLITKPYSEDQVQSAVSQAMFFASTETLKS